MRASRLPISIPNILTVFRILLTPLLVILLLRGHYLLALLVFTVAGITDALDGLIARWLNQRTELGAHLDPIADKLLLMAAFVSLAIYQIIPAWLAVIVISRDVLILLGIAILFITGVAVQIKPSLVSKATTLFQLLTVFLVLLHHEFPRITGIIPLFCWLTAALTILSGLHYVYIGLKILQAGSNNHRNRR